MLEWLGDVGGLYDGLLIVSTPLLGSLASIAFNFKVLQLGFKPKIVDSQDKDPAA